MTGNQYKLRKNRLSITVATEGYLVGLVIYPYWVTRTQFVRCHYVCDRLTVVCDKYFKGIRKYVKGLKKILHWPSKFSIIPYLDVNTRT